MRKLRGWGRVFSQFKAAMWLEPLCDSAWSPGCLCAFWDPPPFMGGPCTPALLSVQCWEGEVPQGMKGPSSPCESGKWHWYVGMPQRAALSR